MTENTNQQIIFIMKKSNDFILIVPLIISLNKLNDKMEILRESATIKLLSSPQFFSKISWLLVFIFMKHPHIS